MRVRFREFSFDPQSGELRLDGQHVPLAAQPASVLALLVAHAGELVTRETIRESIWTDRVIDFEQGINACIRDIRRALGDECDAPRYVETLPKKGYRFIAPVSTEGCATLSAKRASPPRLAMAAAAAVLFLFLGPAVGQRTAEEPPLTGQALEHYQAGRMWLEKHSPDAQRQAVERLQQAATLAPADANVWAALALAWLRYPDRPQHVSQLAGSAARLALSLRPQHPEALLALANSAFHHDWDWERARKLYVAALRSDPRDAGVRQGYGTFLIAMGETAEGFSHLERAYELAPLATVLQSDISWFLTAVGRPREALEWCERLTAVAPDDQIAMTCAYRPLLALGDTAGAVRVLRTWLERRGGAEGWLERLDPREPQAALAAYREWRREMLLNTTEEVSSLDWARIAADEGRAQEAIARLRSAVEERDPLVPLVPMFPEFQALAGLPSYRELLDSIREGRFARRVAQCYRPSTTPYVDRSA